MSLRNMTVQTFFVQTVKKQTRKQTQESKHKKAGARKQTPISLRNMTVQTFLVQTVKRIGYIVLTNKISRIMYTSYPQTGMLA